MINSCMNNVDMFGRFINLTINGAMVHLGQRFSDEAPSSSATTTSSPGSLNLVSGSRKGSARIKRTDKLVKASGTGVSSGKGASFGVTGSNERGLGPSKGSPKIEHLCTLCQFSTKCSLELNDHLKQHLSDSECAPQKCTFCTVKLESLEALHEHVAREHHREKESLTRMLTAFKCSLCGLQANDYSMLSGHSCPDELIGSPGGGIGAGTGSGTSNVTSATSSALAGLLPVGLDPSEPVPASGVYPNSEIQALANEGGAGTQYACDFCPYITFNLGSFHRHRNKHKSAPAIKCVYCGRPMISKCAYESHVARQHVESLLGTIRQNMEGQGVRCMFCDESCPPKQLNKHIDLVHQNAKNCLLDRSKAQKV